MAKHLPACSRDTSDSDNPIHYKGERRVLLSFFAWEAIENLSYMESEFEDNKLLLYYENNNTVIIL